MALHLHDRNVAHQIAKRIRTLIARHDGGDVTVAAHRLERPIADVCNPEGVIVRADPAALHFLATVVRIYDADACWLVAGTPARNAARLSSEVRGTIVELLDELGDRLLDEVRRERDDDRITGRPPPQPPARGDQPTSDGAIPMA